MPTSREPAFPRIEADLLAEYILANPSRRERILLDQRASQDGQGYFRAADETVCGYLLGIPKQELLIRTKIEVLKTLRTIARDKDVKIGHNIAALKAFLNHPKREFLDDLETFPGLRRATLRMAGIGISVGPEIIAVDPDTNSFGFLKLRFSRRPLEPEVADYLMAILLAYSQLSCSSFNGVLNLDLTCIVDVFDGTLLRASSPRVTRWTRVREACAEIASHWPLLYSRPCRGLPARRKAY